MIEKTIHNILFIKTHMQRQDEFDAVRPRPSSKEENFETIFFLFFKVPNQTYKLILKLIGAKILKFLSGSMVGSCIQGG